MLLHNQIIEYLTLFIDYVGIGIIFFGFVKSFIKFILSEKAILAKKATFESLGLVKSELGTYLLLGLEFIIAADIIQTISNPDLNNLISLAGIVVIRIAISYFLGKEIRDQK